MATVVRRGDRYRAQVRVRGRSLSRSFPDRRTALAWACDLERSILAGQSGVGEAHRWTLGSLVHRFLTDAGRRPLRDERALRQRLEWWRGRYGHVALADVTPALIAEAKAALARGTTPRGTLRSPATVNRYVAALSSVLRAGCSRYHVLYANPARVVSREHEPRFASRALDVDEQRALLAGCGDDLELRTAILFALSTACRRGELDGLRWSSVDLDAGIARFAVTKNGCPRAVPVPRVAVEALRSWRAVHFDADGGRVFRSRGDWLLRRLGVLAERLGLGALRWHDLRHSAATALARAGAALPELMAITGHRSPSMVARYQHLSEAPPRGAVDRAAALLD